MSYTTSYETTKSADGTVTRTNTLPDADNPVVEVIRPDGSREVTYPDGTVVTTSKIPDSRYGFGRDRENDHDHSQALRLDAPLSRVETVTRYTESYGFVRCAR